MGSRPTKYDLDHITDYVQFEYFCNDMMAMQGYTKIEPIGGHKDRGRDALDVDESTGKVTIFSYSVREDWEKKLDEDLNKIEKHKHPCNKVVYLTTSSPTATERDNKKKQVKKKYGCDLEFYDHERIAMIVDSCKDDRLRTLHPDIFLISTLLPKFASPGRDLDRRAYAQYLLVLHDEWREKYTPLLADHREMETFVARIESKTTSPEIPVAKVPEVNHISLLLAESGAGKTTAVWRIIVEKCQSILEEKSEQIPILINLRGWSSQHTCRDLAQEQFAVLDIRREAVEEELQRGRCLLLLDGLNEIPLDLRTEAYQDIARFLSTYQENIFLVTCRASDYEPRMLDQEKLSVKVKYPQPYEIRRMGRDQIVDYVRKYFGEDETCAKDLLSKLGIYDSDVWDNKKSIVHLARIPLYLQLFISEYKRTGELPTSQAKLLQALIYITLAREKGRQAGAIDPPTKERLLAGFAYQGLIEGYLLQLPEIYSREIFGQQVQKLKDRSEILPDLTVGVIWQEIISNNFLRFGERPYIEWLHQLIFDYFLAVQIVRIWTVGTDEEKGKLTWSLGRYSWTQPCAIALGLIDSKNGARFLERLIYIDPELARRAFEAQAVADQMELAGALVDDVLEEGDTETNRLKLLTVRLPTKLVVDSLVNRFEGCTREMEGSIAEAISATIIEHSPEVMKYRDYGEMAYGGRAEQMESLSSAMRRASDVLLAWTNNKNELVSFYAAKGLYESDKGRSTETLLKLYDSSNAKVVRLVKDLMDEWGIE